MKPLNISEGFSKTEHPFYGILIFPAIPVT
jgi:hypothetical protein